jgi:transcriptional regulator with XRE-family HTH domain
LEVPAKPSLLPFKPDSKDLHGVVAYRVLSLLVCKKWSQERLAFESELDWTYALVVERSQWNISLGKIERLAAALDVTLWELLVPLTDDE